MAPVILNLLVLAFILAMGYVWLTYGLFSAFLHLVIVVIAGAVTLAIWEPLTVGVLLGVHSELAWGLGLMLPFGVLLGLMRVAVDKAIPDDIKFPRLIDNVGGAVFGLTSGVLTAGMILLGIGFLPTEQRAVFGREAYVVGANGDIQPGSTSLWVPADRIAAGFFAWASAGGFGSSTPMHLYRPDLARDAGTITLAKSYDPNQNLYARPGNVELTRAVDVAVADLVAAATPDGGGEPLGIDAEVLATLPSAGGRLLLVETVWQAEPEGAYDTDTTLRLPPVQVRLQTFDDDGDSPELVAPIAFVGKGLAGMREPAFYPIHDNQARPYGLTTTDETIRWLFRVPTGREPAFLRVRGLRLPIEEDEVTVGDLALFAEQLGRFAPEVLALEAAEEAQQTGAISPRSGAVAGALGEAIQQTTELPVAIDKNKAPGLDASGDPNNRRAGQLLNEGRATITDARARAGRATTIERFAVPSHLRMLRLKVTPDLGASLYGRIRQLAAATDSIRLTDDQGDTIFPFAFVWVQSNGTVTIEADRGSPIRSVSSLPLSRMNRDDELYLYFIVQPNSIIEKLHIGGQTSQDVEFRVN